MLFLRVQVAEMGWLVLHRKYTIVISGISESRTKQAPATQIKCVESIKKMQIIPLFGTDLGQNYHAVHDPSFLLLENVGEH